jgi:Pyridoxamine 5'-phosphate oxidase
MGTWETFERDAPDLAAFVRERMHLKVAYLGTLRADGGPRVNPVTPWFAAGRLFIRMYPGSVKVRALERDARYALHSAVPDDDGTGGEAVVWGTASVVDDADLLAAANQGRFDPQRYVVLEFGVDEVLVTTYEGDDTIRRRWP